MTSPSTRSERAYLLAKEQYAEWGVDVDAALARLEKISISLHCWQGDDVSGFENSGELIAGGYRELPWTSPRR
jgi:L-rhamnose isomerase